MTNPSDVLDAVDDLQDPRERPVVTADDVAEVVGVTPRRCRDYLHTLTDVGELRSREIGRSRVWWIPPAEMPAETPAETPAEERGTAPTPPAETPEHPPAETSAETSEETIEDVLREWTPGQGHDDREARREIGRRALRWLVENGPASRSDFEAALFEETRLETQQPDGWWATVKAALDVAREKGVVEYRHGKHLYRWVGE